MRVELLVLLLFTFSNRLLSQTKNIIHNVNLNRFLSAIDIKLDPIVDANVSHMAQVYHKGNLCPFKRKVVTKMAARETVKVMIIGGSATWGTDLEDRMKQRWSYHFERMLNAGWYKGTIEVNNIAVGACNVDTWIERVYQMTEPDIILVDLSVNDQTFDLRLLPHLYQRLIRMMDNLPNHPALLFLQTFRTAKDDPRELVHCPQPEEQGTCCGGGYYMCRKWWQMQDYVAIAFRTYSVPYISFRDLLWPDFYNPSPHLDVIWNGLSHPDYKAHAMMGKLMAFAFYMQLKEAHRADHCSDSLDDATTISGNSSSDSIGSSVDRGNSLYVSAAQFDPSVQPVCARPLTSMIAGDSASTVSHFQLSPNTHIESTRTLKLHPPPLGWRFYNDSKSKFGWILQTDSTQLKEICGPEYPSGFFCPAATALSTISLPVEFGPDPRLQVLHLQSYGLEMGSAKLWIDDDATQYLKLPSHWFEHYSLTTVATITRTALVSEVSSVLQKENMFLLPSMTPGNHTVHISAARMKLSSKFKWKLLGIVSC